MKLDPRTEDDTAASPTGARRMSRGEDLVTVAFSGWLMVGLSLDGWAHNTRPGLESFFTPWHAAFYTGFVATAAWVLRSITRRQTADTSWQAAVPPGYGLAVGGLVIFAASGLGDLAWHQAFGIEQDINALFSPTHLGLFVGAILVITSPLRSQWADPDVSATAGLRRILPAVLSLALAGSLAAFINQELHPIYDNFASLDTAQFMRQAFGGFNFVRTRNTEAGYAAYLLATVFLFGPLLLLARRTRLPAGAVTVVFLMQCVLVDALDGFADKGLLLAAVAGTAAVTLLAAGLKPGPSAVGRLRAFFGFGPPLFWGTVLALVALGDGGLGWPAEVWGGVLVWSGLAMAALTVLLFPPPLPGPAGPEGTSERRVAASTPFPATLR